MDMKHNLSKLREIRGRDVAAVFPMLAGWIGSISLRGKYRDVWAVCERRDEASDNGYHFFKYMTREHPEQKCWYFIDPACADYDKVKELGVCKPYGGVQMWMAYFACPYLISSQSFKPNGRLATALERLKLVKPHHVFLQHGVTAGSNPQFLHADRRIAEFFITATEQETEFIKANMGYPEENIVMTGFPRFDALHDCSYGSRQIFVMPTWRKWLTQKSERHEGLESNLMESEFVKAWLGFLRDEKLHELMVEQRLKVVFLPHPNMKRMLNLKGLVPEWIEVGDMVTGDIQALMKESDLLITDYSSVSFDMNYMKKPVIFYQFDEKLLRRYHYPKGWFDYHRTAFGPWCGDKDAVIAAIRKAAEADFQVDEAFLEEHKRTFTFNDVHNSERVFEVLKRGK